MDAAASVETHNFQAEVGRLLDLVARSLYADPDVFLRELVANAADACDRLRYEAITRPELLDGDASFRVDVTVDRAAGTLTVGDRGIGMDRAELVDNLGTIARSGTARFLETLKAGPAPAEGGAPSLIGQFGVGFYAAFMVAARVDVLSRKAGAADAWLWSSDGRGAFTIAPAEAQGRGTRITLHLKDEHKTYLDEGRLREIVTRYADHIAVPVYVGGGEAPANRASALWMRPKGEIAPETHAEFFRSLAPDHGLIGGGEPYLTLHWRAEGRVEYASLLYVPKERPYDLYDPSRAHRVRLHVRRVFITDRAEGLVPPWLRFLRGVVDAEDLPLNVSRETLQQNAIVAQMRRGIVRKVLQELTRAAEADVIAYAAFWEAFGAVLKEGLVEDPEYRTDLLTCCRFRSTLSDGYVSLADYTGRMKDGQAAIYYLTAESAEAARISPHLEGFRAKGVEVLLLTDPVDPFWTETIGTHAGKPLRSVTRAGADLASLPGGAEEAPPATYDKAKVATLVAVLKTVLEGAVRDVRPSDRLRESPAVLVAAEGDLDLAVSRLMKAHGHEPGSGLRILELNPGHPLVAALAARAASAGANDPAVRDAGGLLLDLARIVDGDGPSDPAAFSRRLAAAVARGLSA